MSLAPGQEETPLLDALLDYIGRGTVRFHMPGHKGGRGIHGRLRDYVGEAVFQLDVTGVMGLDDLHEPAGPIMRAQALAAEAFGAGRSYFLINGTSSGIHAMILTACAPGDKIIVARNMHKSILSGIILASAQPVYLAPEVDQDVGLALGVTPEAVEGALKAHSDAAGVLLVNPTYYGTTTDLKEIAEVVHARGKPLLVDEAHGPHFRFHPDLPVPAMEAGADACAQGMHKIIGGMTQASILHVREGRLDLSRLKAVLRLIQSTSASYVLMASLDVARMQIATRGMELLGRAMELSERLRSGIAFIPGLKCFGPERLGRPGARDLDPTKVTITVKGLGITGQEAEVYLRRRHDIQVELSDVFNILLIVGFGNTEEDVDRVLSALGELSSWASREKNYRFAEVLATAASVGTVPPIPPLVAIPRDAFEKPWREVSLEASAGQVCAEVITCYPPGIPIICPGERITAEVVDYLTVIRRSGLRISGPADPSLETLRIL